MRKPTPWEVGTADELKRKYGPEAFRWEPIILNPNIVPPELHDLIPLASLYGVSDDISRHELGEKASDADLAEVKRRLQGRHEQIWDFLYSFEEDERYPEECTAFQALLVFELEECNGPGIPGYLDYAIRKWERSPTEMNRARIRQAYQKSQTFWPEAQKPKYVAEMFAKAEAILGAAG